MLKAEIEQKVKEALKAGDHFRLSTLRFLLASIQNEEIAKQRPATDEEVVVVIQRQIKQHRESIEAYQKGARQELAQKEEEELKILQNFLPQQLSEEEVKVIVQAVMKELPETERKNFGKVMGAVMAKVKGKVDGNTVSQMVKEALFTS